MRLLGSFVLLLGGCTAIDNFGQFKIGSVAGADLGSSCTDGCTCIAADPTLNIPAHCAFAPSNSLTCAGHDADTLSLDGAYTIVTGDPAASTTPPRMTGPGISIAGSVDGNVATFCIGSLITTGSSTIAITGHRPLAILADSNIQFSGTITLGGVYAIDENGTAGGPGGTPGGDSATDGTGTSGGKGGSTGSGTMGTGGGAGGSGGSLFLESPTVMVASSSCLSVVGGPGGGGGGAITRGGDAKPGSGCGFSGMSGAGGSGGGGAGAQPQSGNNNGGNATTIGGGGGGLGSYGHVVIRTHNPPTAAGSSAVPAAAYTAIAL